LSSTSINFITSLGRSVFFDPIIWEIITALIASWVGYKIINKIHPRTIKPLLAALLPWTVLLVSYLLVEIIFKPSFNYSRPLGYSIINEPPIVSLYNRIFGAGESAPSGFVVRQMVLALTVILLNHHPQSLSKTKFSKILVDILATLSVIFIGFWRVGVGAHSLFDVVFAIGCGSIIFWLTYVIPYSLLHKNGALNSVSAMFLLFIGVFVFYANNPARWMISSFAFLVLLRLIEYINKDPHTL
jgi:membrane-associated phospholipid phosphatase